MKASNRWQGKSRKARASQRNEAHKGAASTHSNEGGNNTAAEQTKVRRRTTDPMWAVNAIINRKFKSLPAGLQSTDTKRACADAVLTAHTDLCPDKARYYAWLLGQAELIRRSYHFTEDCDGADAQAVSEHLVVEGKKVVTLVRLNGIAATIPATQVKMFGQSRLVPEEFRYEKKSGIDTTEDSSHE